MQNLVVAVILLLIIFFAIRYIYKSKKRGAKCIGCPYSCSCDNKKQCNNK